MLKRILNVNGVSTTVVANPEDSLAEVLRSQLGLTGTKIGCGQGQCGACSVILDGRTRALLRHQYEARPGRRLRDHRRRHRDTRPTCTPSSSPWWHPRRAPVRFLHARIRRVGQGASGREPRPQPGRSVRNWFQVHRNACRCNGYKPIVDAVMDAAKVLRGEMPREDLEFKMPADGRIWGTSYPAPTAVAKVTGTIDYGADLGLKMPPDTLRLALVHAEVSTPTSWPSTPPRPRRCPASSRWSPTRTSRARTGSPASSPSPPTRATAGIARSCATTRSSSIGDAIAIVCADTEEQRQGRGGEGQGGTGGAARLHERAGGHGRGCHRDPSGTPNVYFEQAHRQGTGHRRRSWSPPPTRSRTSSTSSASRT